MPEGDTIHKTAAALRPLLVGRTIQAARARVPGPMIERVVGSSVTQVEARGKHLVIHFDNGLALHTHLRMGGSWHRYNPGERWRRAPSQARVVLEVPEHVVVCFNAPVAELIEERVLARHPALTRLGPDLLAPVFDIDEAVLRLRNNRADVAIGEALLDQQSLAGIGNVYKSEVLFLERLHPWTTLGELDEPRLRSVLVTAERLLRANAQPRAGPRITTTTSSVASRLWVYARADRPCFRCRTLIQARRQGKTGRLTYWCPTCQSLAGSPPVPGSSRTAGP
jgi:endonuclease VIII